MVKVAAGVNFTNILFGLFLNKQDGKLFGALNLSNEHKFVQN